MEELGGSRDLNTDNAFQTDPSIIKIMWDMLQKCGFRGGRILEPASNIGLFPYHQPEDLKQQSEWILNDIDPLTIRIARHLVPNAAGIYTSPFEELTLPKDHLDLVISNFPFGAQKPFDPVYADVKPNLHNYFFLKSLDLLRLGGLILAITSTSTLDNHPEFREAFWKRGAELICAFRLPKTAFKKQNTEVTTDLLLFRKTEIPRLKDSKKQQRGHRAQAQWMINIDVPQWLEDGTHTVYGKGVPKFFRLNQYFADHCSHILGIPEENTLYGRQNGMGVAGDERDLHSCILERTPENIYQPVHNPTALRRLLLSQELINSIPAFRYLEIQGQIYQYQPDQGLVLITEHSERIRAALNLHQQLERLITAEVEDWEETQIEGERRQLKLLYEQYVRQYGNLLDSSKRNTTLLGQDPELNTMLYALEAKEQDESGVIRYLRQPILNKRISYGQQKLDPDIQSPADALAYSLNMKGAVDINLICQVLEQDETQVLDQLCRQEQLILHDPAQGRWLQRSEYLSGHTHLKRQQLKTFRDNELWQQCHLDINDQLLESRNEAGTYQHLAPYLLPPASAEIRLELHSRLQSEYLVDGELSTGVHFEADLGSPWLQTQDIEKFLSHLLQVETHLFSCHHYP
ncbi:MAG: hypothetical protein HC921_16815, partial [Synechococcaceae cyanobacterium SM2_3_1]|nr:hypothetical protein [Synechococcaceae cyanobacterium SM2_3_1]